MGQLLPSLRKYECENNRLLSFLKNYNIGHHCTYNIFNDLVLSPLAQRLERRRSLSVLGTFGLFSLHDIVISSCPQRNRLIVFGTDAATASHFIWK